MGVIYSFHLEDCIVAVKNLTYPCALFVKVTLITTDYLVPVNVFQIARRLNLQHHPKCKNMGGGQAMETLAKEGDIHILDGKHMFRMKSKDCDFSFISLKQAVTHFIHESEELQGSFVLLCGKFQW